MTKDQLDAIRARLDEVPFLPFEATLVFQLCANVRALLDEVERLRAAHAMAVQVSGELCEKCGWAMKFPGEKCRCELLAEVERLHADPLPAAAWVREVERAAFSRGVAAMRKAAADLAWLMHGQRQLAQHLRALPDPEDKS